MAEELHELRITGDNSTELEDAFTSSHIFCSARLLYAVIFLHKLVARVLLFVSLPCVSLLIKKSRFLSHTTRVLYISLRLDLDNHLGLASIGESVKYTLNGLRFRKSEISEFCFMLNKVQSLLLSII